MILTGNETFEFKPLFTKVYTNLRARNLANGGEDMLRLRVYEKLQELVNKGMVEKVNTRGLKEYSGLASLVAALPAPPAEALPISLDASLPTPLVIKAVAV